MRENPKENFKAEILGSMRETMDKMSQENLFVPPTMFVESVNVNVSAGGGGGGGYMGGEAGRFHTVPTKTKTEEKMEEEFEKMVEEYLETRNIWLDDRGYFIQFIPVAIDNPDLEDHSEGAIFNEKRGVFVTTESGVKAFLRRSYSNIVFPVPERHISIKEDLLRMSYRVFEISVNKKDIIGVRDTNSELGGMLINKYRVLGELNLRPQILFNIVDYVTDPREVPVTLFIHLYNSINERGKNIQVSFGHTDISLGQVRNAVIEYLDQDRKLIELKNLTLKGASIND